MIDIQPGPERTYQLDAGLLSVEVVGKDDPRSMQVRACPLVRIDVLDAAHWASGYQDHGQTITGGCSERIEDRGRDVTYSECLDHQSRASCRETCIDQRGVHSGVGFQQRNKGRYRAHLIALPVKGAAMKEDNSVGNPPNGAEVKADECRQILRIRLGGLGGRRDDASQADQHAESLRGRMCCDRHGITEISRPIPVWLAAVTHGSDHHDRLGGINAAVQEIRRFFQGIGSVGHNHSVNSWVIDVLRNDLGDLPHALDGDVRTRERPILMHQNVGHGTDPRNARKDLAA